MRAVSQRGSASTNDGLPPTDASLLIAGVGLALRLAALVWLWKYGAMVLLLVFRGILWVIFQGEP